MKHIIVGIDSGKTSALACIDLNGRPVRLETGRFVGLKWFVDKIKETGVPVVIACDKGKPYRLVSKLSTIFGAVLFTPETDISVLKKKLVVEEGVRNLHERDALASAKIAYNSYANKLKQAEKLANQKGADSETVKALVVKRHSIYEAIKGIDSGRK